MILKPAPRKRTRIQAQNEAKILRAALNVFSVNSYRGATVDQIAGAAAMSKANVLYYFNRKQDIYTAVLEQTLSVWLDPLDQLDPEGDPIEQIWQYALQKLMLSKQDPLASRLFANEILQGAPIIRPFLETELKTLVEQKCSVIQRWIDSEQIVAVAPLHLLFFIWSSTQHYADFAPQINALTEDSEDELFYEAQNTLKLLLTRGLAP